MQLADLEGRQRMLCPTCGHVQYENPVPGVGVLIEHGESVVLIQRDRPPHAGHWALPSGYVEADERVEQAAVREAKEETGLDIELIEMFGVYSFPEGPPRSGLIIFYRARALNIAQLKAADDARAAALYRPEDMPEICFRTHREVLSRWRAMRLPQSALNDELADLAPAGVSIRRARENDYPRILELAKLLPTHASMSDGQRVQLAERIRYSPDLEIWVAEANDPEANPIVGFVSVSMPTTLLEPRAWLDAQVVEPGYRRRGVGRVLFEVALRRARESGAAQLLVDVKRGNTPAQEFYHACGFGSVGEVEAIKIR